MEKKKEKIKKGKEKREDKKGKRKKEKENFIDF